MRSGLGAWLNPGATFGGQPYTNRNMELDLIDYQGFASRDALSRCLPLASEGGNVLVGFTEDNQNQIIEWVDGRVTYNGTPRVNATAITNHELRASGFTPLARSITSAQNYMDPIQNADPYRTCRSHILVIITDGEDTCAGNPVTSVNNLYAAGIRSYTIGFAFSSATLNQMADRGDDGLLNGSRSAYNASNLEQLSAAFQDIIENTVLVEICDGDDDDCDSLIDEGFTKFCNRQGRSVDRYGQPMDCGTTSSLICCHDPGETACNGQDDNCDGSVDEGLLNACGT
jgi:hypothetical protein